MKPTAIVFDLFGTLLDIASLNVAAGRYGANGPALVTTWRDKQINYAFAATIMNAYEDFDVLTLRALEYAAARHGVHADAHALEELAGECRRLQAYPDAADALTRLRDSGQVCGVLTNGTPATATAALASAGLAASIDALLSVDSLRVYKPDRRVYESARAHFDATPNRIVFVTSNGWDATGAARFGFTVVWCNRANAPAETFGPPPAAVIHALSELPQTVAELR